MQSTTDAWEETTAKWQTANYSIENTTAPVLPQGSPMTSNYFTHFKIAVLVMSVLSALGNILVLVGFGLAGRSKMNTSSIYIANHTALDVFSTLMNSLRHAMDISGMLSHYDVSHPGDQFLCIVIDSAVLVGSGSYGSVLAVVVITLDRYWKIVHPIHHRKHYRRWMVKLGLILPWFGGFVVKFLPSLPTSKIVNGRCFPLTFWAASIMFEVKTFCCST